jgi:TP901 family phage tail tape measure protein
VFTSLQAKVVAVGTAIAAYFGISAFAGVVRGAADLEQAMSRVQAATGASAEEMAALRKAVEDAGANTKFTSTEAAGALENLAKAGLNASEAIETLPAVLNLAQAGDIGLAESSELVTKAVMGMGLAFSEAGRVADVLALGANATNTSVLGLAQALSYAAPVANSLGLSLETTVAIIGKFADAGIDASRAGTALNSILSQFSNPASKFRGAYRHRHHHGRL